MRARFVPEASSPAPCAERRALLQSRLSPGLVLRVLGVPGFGEWAEGRGGLNSPSAVDCRRLDRRANTTCEYESREVFQGRGIPILVQR